MPSTPLISVDRLADYASFSDESCADGNHRYMIIGGILCRSFDAHRLSARIAAIRAECRFRESIQWKSLNEGKFETAKRIIDVFLEGNASRKLDFNCIVFDQTKVKHGVFNENDPDLGFFKFLYQHYNKHRRMFGHASSYRCFHGNRETAYDMNEMRKVLNNAASQDADYGVAPYKIVEFRKVKETNLLQMADLLIGAVGFEIHEKGLVRPDSPKARLAAYLRKECPCDSLAVPTKQPDRGFSIWHFELG